MINTLKYIYKIFLISFLTLSLTSCAYFNKNKENDEKTATIKKKRINPNVNERAREAADNNSIFGKMAGNKGTNFEFATSNVLWKATLNTLDFLPLSEVDYSGGYVSTDWYSDQSSNESIKISVRFLSNEIKSTSIKVISYKKKCTGTVNCSTANMGKDFNDKIKSNIMEEVVRLNLKKENEKK
jgi:hypothetical protein